MMKTMLRLIPMIAVLGYACVFLAACGGGGSGSPAAETGRFVLTVKWPQPSRLIPAASNSIKAVLTGGGAALGQQILVRPAEAPWTTTVTFENLQPGAVTLTATAFPNANATGVAQATGSADATITAGQAAQAIVTMASTIVALDVTPPTSTIQVGSTVQLTATPRDASGAVVLVAPGNITWASGTTATATVNGSGLVTGVTGSATAVTITATESDSHKSGNATVTVTAIAPPANTGPTSSAIDPTGRFLYVIDNLTNAVSQFAITSNGSLSPLSPATVSVALPPVSIRADPAQGSHTLYVGASDNTNGAIFQFNINANGTLTPLSPASPPSTSQPVTIVIDPTGRFLYDLDHNEGIRSFIINANGTLSQNGPDLTNEGQLFSAAITSDGKFLYSSGGPREYRINANGTLTFIGALTISSGNPQGMTIDPVAPFLYATFVGATAGIDVFTINADGTLTKNGPAVLFSQFAFKSAITPDGKFLYAVALNTPDNVVAQYAINANGTLTPLSPATVPAGSFTSSVSISPDGQFVYVTNLKDNTISQFKVNANGTLTPLSPPSRPA